MYREALNMGNGGFDRGLKFLRQMLKGRGKPMHVSCSSAAHADAGANVTAFKFEKAASWL